jgi:hypothetical protein
MVYISEIASVIFFHIYLVVFTALAKYPLLPKRNPYIEEKTFSLLILKKETDDKFVDNYSFSFISYCLMAIDKIFDLTQVGSD